jgi:hypothetical protein
MVEAEKDDCGLSAPAPLLSAVETILREIGEEPEREVCDSVELQVQGCRALILDCKGVDTGCAVKTSILSLFPVFLMLLHCTSSRAGGVPPSLA